MALVSIIMPNLHTPTVGDAARSALQQQTANDAVEVLVVGQDRYGRVPAGVTFIQTPQPVSVGVARNIGAAHARGEYLLFLDADCIAVPALVAHVLAAHRAGYDAVGGSVRLEPTDRWVQADNLLVFGDHLNTLPAGPRQFLPGFCFSVRRAAYDTVGGFDPRFVGAAGGDDGDFCLRLLAAGFRLWFAPEAAVAHRPSRASVRAVWQHLRNFGRAYVGNQYDHHTQSRSPLLRLGRFGPLLMGVAPLLALTDTLRACVGSPLRGHISAVPGYMLGRWAWYTGVAEALMIRHTLQ